MEPADHQEGEEADQDQGEDESILLGRDGVDEVCVQVRHVTLHDPLARSAAEQAPRSDGLSRTVHLVSVGGLRVDEPVHATGHVRKEEIGRHQTAGGDDAQPHYPGDGHSRHPEGGAEGHRDQDGLPHVRLDQQQAHGNPVEGEGDGHPRHALSLLRLGEHPGDQDDQGGLHELGRLQGKSAEVEPSRRALGGVPDEGQGRHDDDGRQVDEEGRPADPPVIEEGGTDQYGRAGSGEDALPERKVEGIADVHPRRSRGTGGEGHGDAKDHQDGNRTQQPAVHGPPPHADAGAVGPGEGLVGRIRAHASASPAATAPASSHTASRKAWPRASKSANWSKEAQAGDRSTIPPSPDAWASA